MKIKNEQCMSEDFIRSVLDDDNTVIDESPIEDFEKLKNELKNLCIIIDTLMKDPNEFVCSCCLHIGVKLAKLLVRIPSEML